MGSGHRCTHHDESGLTGLVRLSPLCATFVVRARCDKGGARIGWGPGPDGRVARSRARPRSGYVGGCAYAWTIGEKMPYRNTPMIRTRSPFRSTGWGDSWRISPAGSDQDAPDGPVFVDETGRRSRRYRRIGVIVGIACAVYAVIIVGTLLSGNSSAPWLPIKPKDDKPASQVGHTRPPGGLGRPLGLARRDTVARRDGHRRHRTRARRQRPRRPHAARRRHRQARRIARPRPDGRRQPGPGPDGRRRRSRPHGQAHHARPGPGPDRADRPAHGSGPHRVPERRRGRRRRSPRGEPRRRPAVPAERPVGRLPVPAKR